MTNVVAPGNPPVVDVSRVFNPYLHGARGLFALMIVLFHVANSRLPTAAFLEQGPGLFLVRTLEHGVELFFGVSGIVIVGALRRASSPWTFAIDRATRIYPVLWVCVSALVLMESVTHFRNAPAVSPGVFLVNLLALPPLLPMALLHPAAWSLNYELAFYLFCAVAWVGWRRFERGSLLLVVPVAALLVLTHVRTVLMPVGMLVACWALRPAGGNRLFGVPGMMLLLFLCTWEWLCRAGGGDLISAPPTLLLRPLNALAFGASIVAATLFFIGVMQGRGWISCFLATPSLQFLGTISYSLYLWHPLVMSVIKMLMYRLGVIDHVGQLSQLLFLTLAIPPSVTIAWLSTITLERQVTPWLRARLLRRNASPSRRSSGGRRAPYPESSA